MQSHQQIIQEVTCVISGNTNQECLVSENIFLAGVPRRGGAEVGARLRKQGFSAKFASIPSACLTGEEFVRNGYSTTEIKPTRAGSRARRRPECILRL